jgi:hypothetical protein
VNCPICDAITGIHTTENKGDTIHRWRRCTCCPHRFRTIAPWLDGKNESDATLVRGTPPEAALEHANSVFTADDIRAIRKERAKGRTLVALSIKYGVHTDTIQKICLRKSYKQVE